MRASDIFYAFILKFLLFNCSSENQTDAVFKHFPLKAQ